LHKHDLLSREFCVLEMTAANITYILNDRASFQEFGLHHDSTGTYDCYTIFVASKDVHPHVCNTIFFASNLHSIVLQDDVLSCWGLHDGKCRVQGYTFWCGKVNALNMMVTTKEC
jgi:hypothetical protein